MRDMYGNEISLGDRVAYAVTTGYNKHPALRVGEVVRIGELSLGVRVKGRSGAAWADGVTWTAVCYRPQDKCIILAPNH